MSICATHMSPYTVSNSEEVSKLFTQTYANDFADRSPDAVLTAHLARKLPRA